MKRVQNINLHTLLAACCLVVMPFSACTKTDKPIVETEVEQDPPPTPEPEPEPLEGFVIASVSGSTDQGETVVITGNGFTTETNATFLFTDFESGSLGASVVNGESGLAGDTETVSKNYLYSNEAPLTGTRAARAAPDQASFGNMYAILPDLEECYVEFFYRYNITDYTAIDAPQIKHTRLTSGSGHTDAPFFGITIQGGQPAPTMTFQYDMNTWPMRYNPFRMTNDGTWHRDTYYWKHSTPGGDDGMRFLRTSWGNQWTYSGSNFFATPDEWVEPLSMTRGTAVANATFKRFYFPFYQRAQQSTILDINHIYIHNSLERVYLSTSPTATASIDFKHVTCPTISRTATGITFKSMIGCLPANEAVYLYVVNADNEMNEEGFLVRAAL